jgi:HSP20 family protein
MADVRNQVQQKQPVSTEKPQPKRPEQQDEPGRGIGMEQRRTSAEIGRPMSMSSPFSLMERLMGDMGRLFEGFGPRGETISSRVAWMPQMDVIEREGKLIVHADLPGVRQEDVKVQVDDDVLTIAGERSHEHEHEAGGVYQCERSYGTFQRSLVVPEGVDADGIQASFVNGVLEIAIPLPKEQAKKGRSIPIRSTGGSGGTPQTTH